MIVGFLGSKCTMTQAQACTTLALLDDSKVDMILHGGSQGAETDVARCFPHAVLCKRPRPWSKYVKSVVDACDTLVLAAADRSQLNNRLSNAAHYAHRTGKNVLIVGPNGEIERVQ